MKMITFYDVHILPVQSISSEKQDTYIYQDMISLPVQDIKAISNHGVVVKIYIDNNYVINITCETDDIAREVNLWLAKSISKFEHTEFSLQNFKVFGKTNRTDDLMKAVNLDAIKRSI